MSKLISSINNLIHDSFRYFNYCFPQSYFHYTELPRSFGNSMSADAQPSQIKYYPYYTSILIKIYWETFLRSVKFICLDCIYLIFPIIQSQISLVFGLSISVHKIIYKYLLLSLQCFTLISNYFLKLTELLLSYARYSILTIDYGQ